jgi:hypothetical protein
VCAERNQTSTEKRLVTWNWESRNYQDVQQNLQQRIKHHAKIKVSMHVKARCFQILSVRSSDHEGTIGANGYKFWVVYCVQQDELKTTHSESRMTN